MAVMQLKPDIYSVGAIDWDRELFDEFIPLPDGTSYNAYIVEGSQRIALIDTVDPKMTDVLLDNLKSLNIKRIDYIICNHAEQDHSGSIPKILEIYPNAKIICTSKCKTMLKDLLLISDDKIITVNDGEKLSLGDKTLEFIHAPWVHWPETMLTYLREDKILFTCDLFGSHLATSDLFTVDEMSVYEPAKRYYAEIMMPFRTIIKKHLERIKKIEIDIIAPSHGPAYKNPKFIMDAYTDWTSDEVKNEVLIPYISMHGSTKKMVDYLIDILIKEGISTKPFNLSKVDIGKFAIALVDAATVVFATPTVLVGPHPNVVYAAYLTNLLKPKLKFVSIIGSYGWGGKAVEQITSMIANLKVDIIDPVYIKGFPKGEDFKSLENLAKKIVYKHREIGII